MTDIAPARIALVGAHGFGAVHRRNLARLAGRGRADLVAVADPSPLEPGELPPGARAYADLPSLLAAEDDLDVVIVSTPLHTHLDLAERVLAAGVDLYLEKPPVTSLAQLARLRAAAEGAGRLVQVGFQSLGSHALPWLRSAIADGRLGEVRAVTAVGAWTRDRAYFVRSRWAGRRTLDGVDVVDGVLTNALSHAVVTALAVAGVRRAEEGTRVEVDLHRANPTESDDTSVVRVRRAGNGPDITCALTLCGPEEAEPFITVHGSKASATLLYVLDEVRVEGPDGSHAHRFDRTDLLENLLDARAGRAELLSALADTEAYMTVLEAVRTAPEPHAIPDAFVDRVGEGAGEHLVVRDIERTLLRAVTAEATFTQLGVPWAVASRQTAPDAERDALRLGGEVVAVPRTGVDLAGSLSPRPYLHPVRTRSGVTLTDHLPLDHPWHLGVGLGLPDANGSNLWGGPDYRAADYRAAGDHGAAADHGAAGYHWAPTHGRARLRDTRSGAGDPGTLTQHVAWLDAAGDDLLHETREWRWEAVDERSWRLRLRFALEAARGPVQLGSPGAKGREGAGYGGFLWRFASCKGVDVRTSDAVGEQAVNGSRSPWLLWRATFEGAPASLLFTAPPESDDPWFVRAAEYPAVGSALAWNAPVSVQPGEPLVRTIEVVVCDGWLEPPHPGAGGR